MKREAFHFWSSYTLGSLWNTPGCCWASVLEQSWERGGELWHEAPCLTQWGDKWSLCENCHWAFIACLSAQAHCVSVPIGLILPFMTYYPMRPSLSWQSGKWLYREETERRRTGKDWDGIELYVLFIGECFIHICSYYKLKYNDKYYENLFKENA